MFLIKDLLEIFGADRQAVLARELTKKFETIYKANLATIKVWLEEDHNRQKGEFVILVHGMQLLKKPEISEKTLQILKILQAEMSLKQAVNLTAKITGENRNDLYKIAVNLKNVLC